jgi:hypothetical protein
MDAVGGDRKELGGQERCPRSFVAVGLLGAEALPVDA